MGSKQMDEALDRYITQEPDDDRYVIDEDGEKELTIKERLKKLKS